MDQSKQVSILRELLGHIEAGTTARTAKILRKKADAYASSDVLQAERRRIFSSLPLVMALSGDIAGPGSFLAQDLAGVPVLLVRSPNGEARAFVNACRHRGTRLVDAAKGCASRFTCRFHAWTYDQEGRLAAIAKKDSFGELDSGELALIPLPVAEKYGIIWVKLEPGPAFDIDDHLPQLGTELAGWDFGGKFAFDTQHMTADMNWKLANDTFGETYHFAILHKNTLSALYHSNVTSYETFGCNHRMVFAARSIGELAGRPESEWELRPHSTIAYYIFPNTQLLVSRQNISMYRMFPDPRQADRCTIYQSVYLDREPQGEEERAIGKAALDRLRAVIVDEDFATAQASQAAFSSGLVKEVVFGRNEPALHHYHAAYERALEGQA